MKIYQIDITQLRECDYCLAFATIKPNRSFLHNAGTLNASTIRQYVNKTFILEF